MTIIVGQGVVDWVALKTRSDFDSASIGIGLEHSGKIVAGVAYEKFNGRNVFMHHAIEGRITRQYLWTVFDYPFNQLKVERVTGTIPAENFKSRNFAERVGFKIEVVLKDAHPSGDILYYVGRRRDFRWINENLYQSHLAMAA